MLGSGALFFSLAPRRAFLADINCELINFYRVLRSRVYRLHAALQPLLANKQTYYGLRASNPGSSLDRAARFFYLVRLSWNGLYRVNKRGCYNVPYGGRRPNELLPLQRAVAASRVLRNARLACGDFEITTSGIKRGDLVYFDPPYPKGAFENDGFSRYSATCFTLDDHNRLARHAADLADRGVHVLVTEAARKEILRFYSKAFRITLVRNPSLIAASSESRRDAYEAILTSYRVEVP